MLKMTWRAVGHWLGPLADEEPTLSELLSDSLVKAVMEADGVDPRALEAELRSVARQRCALRDAHAGAGVQNT
jgi:hypothetical protein